MKSVQRCAILASLLFSGTVAGQDVPDTIPAGTRLRVKLETPVSTKNARVGDAFEGRLDKPVQVRGQVVLPKSVYVSGHVAEVRAANRKEKVFARLRLVFDRVSFLDGRTLVVQAFPLGDNAVYDADSEGVLTPHGVTKGEAAADVAIGAGAGAGVGGIAGGGKGAEVGAGVGATVGALGAWAEAASRWWNIEFIKGDKLWLRLDRDVALAPGEPTSAVSAVSPAQSASPNAGPVASTPSVPPGAPAAPVPPARPVSESPAPAPPQTPSQELSAQQARALRIFLSDTKSWETSGGFAPKPDTDAGREQAQVRPPKPEFLKEFHERCPTVVVTTVREKADYVVLLDHSGWHSPPYRVAVLNEVGDVIYSGGTELLRNAVKDACNAITAHR